MGAHRRHGGTNLHFVVRISFGPWIALGKSCKLELTVWLQRYDVFFEDWALWPSWHLPEETSDALTQSVAFDFSGYSTEKSDIFIFILGLWLRYARFSFLSSSYFIIDSSTSIQFLFVRKYRWIPYFTRFVLNLLSNRCGVYFVFRNLNHELSLLVGCSEGCHAWGKLCW